MHVILRYPYPISKRKSSFSGGGEALCAPRRLLRANLPLYPPASRPVHLAAGEPPSRTPLHVQRGVQRPLLGTNLLA